MPLACNFDYTIVGISGVFVKYSKLVLYIFLRLWGPIFKIICAIKLQIEVKVDIQSNFQLSHL